MKLAPPDIQERIAAWLRGQRGAIWSLAKDAGVPPTVGVGVPVVRFEKENRWTGTHEVRQVNPLVAHRLDAIWESRGPRLNEEAVAIGNEIVDTLGERVRFWAALGHAGYSREDAGSEPHRKH